MIARIDQTYRDRAPLSIVVGGLHAFDDFPMSDDYKASIRHHWQDVNKATGAEFDYRFFDRDGFVLDTAPACRAVVTARHLNKDKALDFYESVSRSFYFENKDTTDGETFKQLAFEAGLDGEAFADLFQSDAMKQATLDDFHHAKSLGIHGFPTVMVKENDTMALLTNGYRPFDQLKPSIDHWLEQGLNIEPETVNT